MAEHFLLNYSQKLWGQAPDYLSPLIAGKRLQGLTLKTFLQEAFKGSLAKTKHLDGAFYYPSQGIGMLTQRLVDSCGPLNIMTSTRVTGLNHQGDRITGITLNHERHIQTDEVVSTIPLKNMLHMMQPRPPEGVLNAARELKSRNIILVALFLDVEQVSHSGTLYFPHPETLFTRVYEPKNRSQAMAPAGKTSLVAEIPCQAEDPVWSWPEGRLVDQVTTELTASGLINQRTTTGSAVHRMPASYPVLEAKYPERLKTVMDYLQSFSNLRFSGRNGLFAYLHLHDLMLNAEHLVLQCLKAGKA